jgi:hypothetical protein
LGLFSRARAFIQPIIALHPEIIHPGKINLLPRKNPARASRKAPQGINPPALQPRIKRWFYLFYQPEQHDMMHVVEAIAPTTFSNHIG